MAFEPEKLGVTEIKVRMDCNGCVQKMKKALHGIIGICELYIDFSQQKVIIVGWADPEKIVKAIKKTRRSAVICSHTEQSEQSSAESSTEPPQEGGSPPPLDSNQAEESQQTEAVPPPEPQAPDNPPPEPEPEPEQKPEPELDSTCSARSQSTQSSLPKDKEEIHVVYHYPPYPYGQNVHQGYGGPWDPHPGVARFRGEPSPYMTKSQLPQPVPMSHTSYNTYKQSPPLVTESQPVQPLPVSHSYINTYRPSMFETEIYQPVQPISVSHSYNKYKPSPYVTQYAHPKPPPDGHYSHYYARQNNSGPQTQGYNYNTYRPQPYASTEYAYPRSPPSSYLPSPSSYYYSHYTRPDNFSQEYYYNGNVTSMFSEENPNACTIV